MEGATKSSGDVLRLHGSVRMEGASGYLMSDIPKASALSGLRVIEMGTLIAGPFAARLLAEFGAEVIKVEPPDGGDPLRRWRKLHQGTSLWWSLQARNKKSVTGESEERRPGRESCASLRRLRTC